MNKKILALNSSRRAKDSLIEKIKGACEKLTGDGNPFDSKENIKVIMVISRVLNCFPSLKKDQQLIASLVAFITHLTEYSSRDCKLELNGEDGFALSLRSLVGDENPTYIEPLKCFYSIQDLIEKHELRDLEGMFEKKIERLFESMLWPGMGQVIKAAFEQGIKFDIFKPRKLFNDNSYVEYVAYCHMKPGFLKIDESKFARERALLQGVVAPKSKGRKKPSGPTSLSFLSHLKAAFRKGPGSFSEKKNALIDLTEKMRDELSGNLETRDDVEKSVHPRQGIFFREFYEIAFELFDEEIEQVLKEDRGIEFSKNIEILLDLYGCMDSYAACSEVGSSGASLSSKRECSQLRLVEAIDRLIEKETEKGANQIAPPESEGEVFDDSQIIRLFKIAIDQGKKHWIRFLVHVMNADLEDSSPSFNEAVLYALNENKFSFVAELIDSWREVGKGQEDILLEYAKEEEAVTSSCSLLEYLTRSFSRDEGVLNKEMKKLYKEMEKLYKKCIELDKGKGKAECSSEDTSVLSLAIQLCQFSLAKMLVENGADIIGGTQPDALALVLKSDANNDEKKAFLTFLLGRAQYKESSESSIDAKWLALTCILSPDELKNINEELFFLIFNTLPIEEAIKVDLQLRDDKHESYGPLLINTWGRMASDSIERLDVKKMEEIISFSFTLGGQAEGPLGLKREFDSNLDCVKKDVTLLTLALCTSSNEMVELLSRHGFPLVTARSLSPIMYVVYTYSQNTSSLGTLENQQSIISSAVDEMPQTDLGRERKELEDLGLRKFKDGKRQLKDLCNFAKSKIKDRLKKEKPRDTSIQERSMGLPPSNETEELRTSVCTKLLDFCNKVAIDVLEKVLNRYLSENLDGMLTVSSETATGTLEIKRESRKIYNKKMHKKVGESNDRTLKKDLVSSEEKIKRTVKTLLEIFQGPKRPTILDEMGKEKLNEINDLIISLEKDTLLVSPTTFNPTTPSLPPIKKPADLTDTASSSGVSSDDDILPKKDNTLEFGDELDLSVEGIWFPSGTLPTLEGAEGGRLSSARIKTRLANCETPADDSWGRSSPVSLGSTLDQKGAVKGNDIADNKEQDSSFISNLAKLKKQISLNADTGLELRKFFDEKTLSSCRYVVQIFAELYPPKNAELTDQLRALCSSFYIQDMIAVLHTDGLGENKYIENMGDIIQSLFQERISEVEGISVEEFQSLAINWLLVEDKFSDKEFVNELRERKSSLVAEANASECKAKAAAKASACRAKVDEVDRIAGIKKEFEEKYKSLVEKLPEILAELNADVQVYKTHGRDGKLKPEDSLNQMLLGWDALKKYGLEIEYEEVYGLLREKGHRLVSNPKPGHTKVSGCHFLPKVPPPGETLEWYDEIIKKYIECIRTEIPLAFMKIHCTLFN